MNRLVLTLLSMGLIAVVAFLLGRFFATKEPRNDELKAVPKESHSVVSAIGRLEPESTVLRLAPSSGNEGACVHRLLVQKGDDVQAGQVLAILDTYDRRVCSLTEAEANAVAARARLIQIEAGSKTGDIAAAEATLASAQAQLAVAKRDLERINALRVTNAISEEEVDVRRSSHDRALYELARTKGVLDSLKEVRVSDVEFQKAMIAVAEASVSTAKSNLDATQLRSPIEGRILEIYTRAGERPTDRGVLEIGSVQRMQAVAEVYEGDVMHVRIGQKAIVHLETFEQDLTGSVVEIGHMIARKIVLTNDPVSDTDARILEVRIDIDPEFVPLVQRMSNARVHVRLEAGSRLEAGP